jgi:hypothetical protein
MRETSIRNLLGNKESRRIFKDRILNFIGAHPRLIPIMAALGISFTFSFAGKTLIHEILPSAYAVELQLPTGGNMTGTENITR